MEQFIQEIDRDSIKAKTKSIMMNSKDVLKKLKYEEEL